jgi:hypothetical protein
MMARECLWLHARRLSRVMTRAYDESLRPLGIQISLNVIALHGEGGAGMSAIAELLVMDPKRRRICATGSTPRSLPPVAARAPTSSEGERIGAGPERGESCWAESHGNGGSRSTEEVTNIR